MEGGVATAETKDPAASLADYKRRFEEWRSLTQEGRTENLVDIDYYDGKQITSGERQILSKRGQPDIVINRIRPAINGILGVTARGKSEPRAFPRTPKDDDSADVATDTLRYIADFNRFDQVKIHCFKDMLVPGTMAAQVLVDGNMQITIEQVRWEELVWDPRSRREDFGDARFMGMARWMSADDVKALYPDKADEIEGAVNTGTVGMPDQAQEDRPRDGQQVWSDPKRRRLFVVEMYEREGPGWNRCVYISSSILADGPSPYLDDKGKTACPIVAASAYLDRDNNRYGASRDMRDVQDEINKRRSKALHYLNTRTVQESAPGMGMGEVDEVRREAAKPDGVLPSGWVIVPTTDQLRGQVELMMEAKAEIERLGPNPAILGRESTDSSGRALLARQQSGLVELGILFSLQEDWELRIYRQCWARAKQFWTAPQWIRVTDDEGAPQFVGLNQPKGQPVIGPDGQPQLDQKTGEPAEGEPVIDPQTGGSVFGYKNQVAELDVDIILDSTPDTANVQAEQFQDLMQLVGSNPTYAQSVPFEMMLELSAVPHKRELIDKLKTYREQSQAAMQQQAQTAAAMEQAQVGAKVRETNASANLKEAQTQTELMKPHLDALQMGIDSQQQQGPPPGL